MNQAFYRAAAPLRGLTKRCSWRALAWASRGSAAHRSLRSQGGSRPLAADSVGVVCRSAALAAERQSVRRQQEEASLEPLERSRREFAKEIRAIAGLRSDRLARAFASVPREDFVGPGPWQLIRPAELSQGYVTTPDADPRRLYDNVLVALDAKRHLNNGEPAGLARWFDCLDLTPGDRVLHIGCGVGYYTAILAETIAPRGSVVGVEIDPQLAERAERNLRPWRNSAVVSGEATELQEAAFDAIFVNAGATEPLPEWLDALRDGGRLLVPMTVAVPEKNAGVGHMLLVVRHPDAHSARFVSPVAIFHCSGARTNEGDDLLRRTYRIGGHEAVRSLRRDAHDADLHCWLHTDGLCLSRLEVES